jgi:hypothetical protein
MADAGGQHRGRHRGRVTQPSSVQLHCHHCQRWLGETSQSLTFAGMFKDPRHRERLAEPRDTYRCKSCGWANLFVAAADAPIREWRAGIDLKAS